MITHSECNSEMNPAYWAAIQVKPNHECVTAEHFGARGLEHFLPLYQTRRRWSDRTKELRLPLFPGYLFCRYRDGVRASILSAMGVVRIVGYGASPAPVDDDEIAAIQRITRSGLECSPMALVETGSHVRINTGALKGVEGRVIAAKDSKHRFVVSLTLLQRSVAVEVDASWLSPIDSVPLFDGSFPRLAAVAGGA